MNVGGNSTSLSAVPGFVATTSDLNATLDFNVSIPDGSSFRPLVTVTTVTNGVPSYSFFFRGSVTVKLGGTIRTTIDHCTCADLLWYSNSHA